MTLRFWLALVGDGAAVGCDVAVEPEIVSKRVAQERGITRGNAVDGVVRACNGMKVSVYGQYGILTYVIRQKETAVFSSIVAIIGIPTSSIINNQSNDK